MYSQKPKLTKDQHNVRIHDERNKQAIRNIRKEKEQFELLQKKWGKQIVRMDNNDRCHNSVKSKARHFDYNPVLHVPIRGV